MDTVKISCSYVMVKHLLRMWGNSHLRPQGVRLAKERPRLIAKQDGVCPLCGVTLKNNGEHTNVDHIVTVEAFALRVMARELTFEEAYTQLWADPNIRALCRPCNQGRRKVA
jgi:5-methylcytosine-specific restriction endonuclease McrA